MSEEEESGEEAVIGAPIAPEFEVNPSILPSSITYPVFGVKLQLIPLERCQLRWRGLKAPT